MHAMMLLNNITIASSNATMLISNTLIASSNTPMLFSNTPIALSNTPMFPCAITIALYNRQTFLSSPQISFCKIAIASNNIEEFKAAFGDNPFGSIASLAQRTDTGESGHLRWFSRDWIVKRDDDLDISWLKDESGEKNSELPASIILAQEAIGELEAVIAELQGTLQELGEDLSL
ncbi:MAG: hypothetical protein SFY66_11905 [Oculatellaceae cyanobacterium bins.114]|nr:hypothetical protein [Oculatellaceae cyanobacterium bins.114]